MTSIGHKDSDTKVSIPRQTMISSVNWTKSHLLLRQICSTALIWHCGGDRSDFDDCRSLYKRQPINNRHRRIVNRLHYDTGAGEGRSPSFKNCATDPDKWKFAIPARTLINQYQSSTRCDYIVNEKKFTYTGVINQGDDLKKIFFYLLWKLYKEPHTFS